MQLPAGRCCSWPLLVEYATLVVVDIPDLSRRAVEVRDRLAAFERSTYGREWTTADLLAGLMVDVGDLAAAVQRAEGIRPERDGAPIDELAHELGDCFWVLLVLADRFEIDVTEAFESTMVSIERWLDSLPGE